MIESWADAEEYGILSENSDSDPSYSSRSSSSDTDDECSESDLSRSRARGKGSLYKGKKIPAHVSSSKSRSNGINNVTETGDASNSGEAEDVGSDPDVDLDLDLGLQRAPVNHSGEDLWRQVTEGATEVTHHFVRQGNTGISPELEDVNTATECLFSLFTDDILDSLLKSINDYAVELCTKNNPPQRYSVFANFDPVGRNEFLRFLAILLSMGVDPRYSIKSYWSTLPHLHTPWYDQTMPRKRFEAIYHTFLQAGGVNAEKQDKIEPFLEKLCESFQRAYYPSKCLSIDEMVIGFRGRWKNKQYNATKPSKYHIKTFGLCDSDNGYVVNFLLTMVLRQAIILILTHHALKQLKSLRNC